jgi:hypothetical protein
MEGTRIQEPTNAKRVPVEKPGGRRRLGIHMSRWNNNIKMDIKETEWEVVKSCSFRIETSGGRL